MGAQARRRWRLMLKCVREPAERGFRGALDLLVATYAPHLAAAAARWGPGEGLGAGPVTGDALQGGEGRAHEAAAAPAALDDDADLPVATFGD